MVEYAYDKKPARDWYGPRWVQSDKVVISWEDVVGQYEPSSEIDKTNLENTSETRLCAINNSGY